MALVLLAQRPSHRGCGKGLFCSPSSTSLLSPYGSEPNVTGFPLVSCLPAYSASSSPNSGQELSPSFLSPAGVTCCYPALVLEQLLLCVLPHEWQQWRMVACRHSLQHPARELGSRLCATRVSGVLASAPPQPCPLYLSMPRASPVCLQPVPRRGCPSRGTVVSLSRQVWAFLPSFFLFVMSDLLVFSRQPCLCHSALPPAPSGMWFPARLPPAWLWPLVPEAQALLPSI